MKIMATTSINCNQKTNNKLNCNNSKSNMSFGMNLVLPRRGTVPDSTYYMLLLAKKAVKDMRPFKNVIVDRAGLWADVAEDCAYASHSDRLVVYYGYRNLLQKGDPDTVFEKITTAALALQQEVEAIIREINLSTILRSKKNNSVILN